MIRALIRWFQLNEFYEENNNANEDHGKLSAATLFLFLFVLFVPTFNVLVSTLVDVCAHSALYNPASATLSLF